MGSENVKFDNQSTIIGIKELADFEDEIANQLYSDFSPYWGLPNFSEVRITLVDNPGPNDPSGALGYHELNSQGVPYARVFVEFAQQQGVAWSIVASHEALELAADPHLNSVTYLPDGNGASGWLVAIEVCDPVEHQFYIGSMHAIPLSNFVLPGWYIPGYSGQVDKMSMLPGPLRIAAGGYASADYVEYSLGWQTFQDFIEERSSIKEEFH